MTDYATIPINKKLDKYGFSKTPFKNNPPNNKPNWSMTDYNKYDCGTPPEFYELFSNINKTINKTINKNL